MRIFGRRPGRARRLASLGLALCAVALPAVARASVGLAPSRADAPFEVLRPGFDRWLRDVLVERGVAILRLPDASPEHALAAAAAGGLPHALLPTLRSSDDGSATVELLLVAPSTGRPLGSARRSAAPGEIGRAAAEALEELGGQLPGEGSFDDAVAPPLLDDLAAGSMALRAWNAGDLPGAFRAVQGKLSPVAMALREEILQEARRGNADPVLRARVLIAAGDEVGAWSLVGRDATAALESSDPDPQLLVAAGEVLLARRGLREARRFFARAVELAPDSADAALGLAEVLEIQQDPKAAIPLLEQAAAQAPDDPRPAEALARLDPEPERRALHWAEAGRRAARHLQVQRARSLLERAVRTHPAGAAAASPEIGALEERLGNPQQALAAYQRAAQAGVRTPRVLTAIGRSQRRLGQPAAAESALRDAVALAPADPEALAELGRLYTETGRAAEAVPLLRKAQEVAPDDAQARITLAHALRATGDADEALAVLTDAATPTATQLSLAAELHAERGEPARAREALARAVALEPGDPTLRTAFAGALEGGGEAGEAETQRRIAGLLAPSDTPQDAGLPPHSIGALSLDDLVMSFAAQVTRPEAQRILALDVREPSDWRTLLWRAVRPRSPDLDALHSGLEAAIAARFQLERREAPDDALSHAIDALYDFDSNRSLDAGAVATVNQVLAVDGAFVTRLVAHAPDLVLRCGAGAFAVEMRLLSGREPELVGILGNDDCLAGGFAAYGRWNPVALGLYALLALAALWPLLRGWGAIQVKIELPERTKGFFSIHVTTRPDQVRREQADKKTKRKKTKAGRFDFLRRFERHMAGRETLFRWIPARKGPYTVTVAGPLLDARGEEIIGHFLEEQRVMVRRRRVSVLVFDFRPKECAIEVQVLADGAPAAGGRVAILGDPASLRYARDGLAYLYVGLGDYTVLVGSQDAAAAVDLRVSSLSAAIPLQVDLSGGQGLVFEGCPEAVEAYLQSDLASAAEALDRAGQREAAHQLRAEHHQRQGRPDDAARELEAAGRIGEAAAIRRSGDDFEGSAMLFEQAADFARAAEAHRAAGAWAEAARCYELAYDYGNAVECWRESGDTEREMLMLEKLGEYMDAAALARELGEDERAVQNLQQIDARHHFYGEACRRIAEIADGRGDQELAIAKLEESMASVGRDKASVETLELYAAVLERAGRKQEALGAYEAIRRRDALRTDVQARIQELRREIEASENATRPATASAPEERRYELLEELGRGGMGVVYKARDKRLGRVVALKQLPENLKHHPAAVELFEREARAAAALNHVNIVTLFDAGQEGGAYFITMELLEGRPLNAILERNGRVSVRDTLRLGVQICAGLHYAHERRIVHRDIKTANLFFTREQVVKVMDFGIAKSLEEVRRSTTVVGGTPYYMAPEQAAGEGVDHRADLYALGVTLFQLVTGQLPFADGDVTHRHRHEAPPDPRELHAKVPEPLSTLILALLEKSPDARPASAAVAGARLQELLTQLG